MPNATVPLFSTFGLRMMYVMIRDKFRLKTADEKLLLKMGQQEKAKQIFDRSV